MALLNRKAYDHEIMHVYKGEKYMLLWKQKQMRGGVHVEIWMKRRTTRAGAERFAAKHGVEMPQQSKSVDTGGNTP